MLFDAVAPNWKKDVDFSFTKDENQQLIAWYIQHIEEQEISAKRLVARDLFTFEQNKLLVEYENNKYDYQVSLLPEISFSDNSDNSCCLTVRDLDGETLVRNLVSFDEAFFYALSSPKLKSELYMSLLSQFKHELTIDEKAEVQTMLTKRIKLYISRKIIRIE